MINTLAQSLQPSRLPIWFLLTLRHSLGAGEPWRCQKCGTARGLFGGYARGAGASIAAMRAVKPAGPSTRAKAKGSKCPQCGQAMIVGVELGEIVFSCQACRETFGAG